MTFATDPLIPLPRQATLLTAHITHSVDDEPVTGLQVLHERVVHNFIINLDFSSFAHIHHEDFQGLSAADLDHAKFNFPYVFPTAGNYRIVSEFTHKNRSWTKHFDLQVGDAPLVLPVGVDLQREKVIGPYHANLAVSPAVPVAGFATELVLELVRDGEPVSDLELILGSEVHVALWRIDGKHFGHTHTYTPHLATMMAAMHDRTKDPKTRAELMTKMMVEMIDMPAELIFHGPQIPVRYVFSEPGTYAIFLHCAPGGRPQVFDFMLEIAQYRDGADTQINSIVNPVGRNSLRK